MWKYWIYRDAHRMRGCPGPVDNVLSFSVRGWGPRKHPSDSHQIQSHFGLLFSHRDMILPRSLGFASTNLNLVLLLPRKVQGSGHLEATWPSEQRQSVILLVKHQVQPSPFCRADGCVQPYWRHYRWPTLGFWWRRSREKTQRRSHVKEWVVIYPPQLSWRWYVAVQKTKPVILCLGSLPVPMILLWNLVPSGQQEEILLWYIPSEEWSKREGGSKGNWCVLRRAGAHVCTQAPEHTFPMGT